MAWGLYVCEFLRDGDIVRCLSMSGDSVPYLLPKRHYYNVAKKAALLTILHLRMHQHRRLEPRLLLQLPLPGQQPSEQHLQPYHCLSLVNILHDRHAPIATARYGLHSTQRALTSSG